MPGSFLRIARMKLPGSFLPGTRSNGPRGRRRLDLDHVDSGTNLAIHRYGSAMELAVHERHISHGRDHSCAYSSWHCSHSSWPGPRTPRCMSTSASIFRHPPRLVVVPESGPFSTSPARRPISLLQRSVLGLYQWRLAREPGAQRSLARGRPERGASTRPARAGELLSCPAGNWNQWQRQHPPRWGNEWGASGPSVGTGGP
jgi:hypothetical protein